MYAVLIEDDRGNVKVWTRGTKPFCDMIARRLPYNGWKLHAIQKVT